MEYCIGQLMSTHEADFISVLCTYFLFHQYSEQQRTLTGCGKSLECIDGMDQNIVIMSGILNTTW